MNTVNLIAAAYTACVLAVTVTLTGLTVIAARIIAPRPAPTGRK